MNEDNINFQVELLTSTYICCSRVMIGVSDAELLHIFNLINNYEEIEIEYKNIYEGITRSTFSEDKNQLSRIIQQKKAVLLKSMNDLKRVDSEYEIPLSKCTLPDNIYLFENYMAITKHVKNRSILAYKLNSSDIQNIINKIDSISRDIIHLKVLNEVTDALLFSECYESNLPEELKKKRVKKVADACLDEMTMNPNISLNELKSIVTNKYIISYYLNNGKEEKMNTRNINKAIHSSYYRLRKKWNC